VHGKEDTLVTIQIDLMLARQFNMTYTDADNTQKFPYIIHRTSLGCYERTIALRLEKTRGRLPMWLSPEQVRVLPIATRRANTQRRACQAQSGGLRCTIDERNEKIGYKIREGQMEKIPYIRSSGQRVEAGSVAVRSRRTRQRFDACRGFHRRGGR
jgi:threonyl-tRNA synthetase